MAIRLSGMLLAACLLTGAAWAQTSSSGATGGSGGGAAPSTGATGSPAPTALPPSQQGNQTQTAPAQGEGAAQSGTDGGSRTGRGTVPSGTSAGPVPPPGTEGSTGGAADNTAAPTTTGGIGGLNRRPGQPSSVPPSTREEDLLIQGEQLEQRARRGICQGC